MRDAHTGSKMSFLWSACSLKRVNDPLSPLAHGALLMMPRSALHHILTINQPSLVVCKPFLSVSRVGSSLSRAASASLCLPSAD